MPSGFLRRASRDDRGHDEVGPPKHTQLAPQLGASESQPSCGRGGDGVVFQSSKTCPGLEELLLGELNLARGGDQHKPARGGGDDGVAQSCDKCAGPGAFVFQELNTQRGGGLSRSTRRGGDDEVAQSSDEFAALRALLLG